MPEAKASRQLWSEKLHDTRLFEETLFKWRFSKRKSWGGRFAFACIACPACRRVWKTFALCKMHKKFETSSLGLDGSREFTDFSVVQTLLNSPGTGFSSLIRKLCGAVITQHEVSNSWSFKTRIRANKIALVNLFCWRVVVNFVRGGALCGARSALSARGGRRRGRGRSQYSVGNRGLYRAPLSLNLIYYLTVHCTETYLLPHVELTSLSVSFYDK